MESIFNKPLDEEVKDLNGNLANLKTMIAIDPSKGSSQFPEGLFPVVWSVNTTINGKTATENRRGIGLRNDTMAVCFVSTAVGNGYILACQSTTWRATTISVS